MGEALFALGDHTSRVMKTPTITEVGDEQRPAWRIIGASVRGASHLRAGLPNQDAIRWWPESGTGLPLILAVSDGHGSAKCFRSDAGARYSVSAAITEMKDLLAGQPDPSNLSAIKRMAEERLPQTVARTWANTVNTHLEANPFSTGELEALESKEGLAARQAVEANPLLAYGATILTVLITELFILYLQLGDGDILVVSAAGEVTRPLPKEERLFGNETTSLCSRDAWRDFRIGFQALSSVPPALILVSTDGYANSFRDEEGFCRVGSDLLEMLRADGVDQVRASLETWLTHASQAGSGDDITLGVMCGMDALERSSVRPLSCDSSDAPTALDGF